MTERGEATRTEILDHATRLVRTGGLASVTIGRLANELALSKSGLFAHFGSKEALEIAILDHAAAEFVGEVVQPALRQSRGAPRLRAAFEGWLRWSRRGPGGCVFVAATAELDDRPGPVRERLVAIERDWIESIAQMVRSGQKDGLIRSEVEPAQVAFELHGLLLAAHHHARLLGEAGADRALIAFERLLESLKP